MRDNEVSLAEQAPPPQPLQPGRKDIINPLEPIRDAFLFQPVPWVEISRHQANCFQSANLLIIATVIK